VATIVLNRPEARNALSDELSPALRQLLATLRDDESVGALLITGAGAAFCAGGDVKAMGASGNAVRRTPEERIALLQERQRLLTGALAHFPKATVAALPGPAAGAGLSIALACDLRIAAESAFVSTAYAKIGLSGDYGIAWMLVRLVGRGRARELMLLPEKVSAARCEALGIVNRVVTDAELHAEAFSLARALANGPGAAYRLMKQNLDDAEAMTFLDALDAEAVRLVESAATDDHREAVAAFVQRRTPRYSGR
jgi:enoyl-CoA hydratase/carnithine racemase